MIRIAVIDDHPALRAGLRTVIDAEPGLVFVGASAGDEESVWPLLHSTAPSLVLLDYHLPAGDGLQLCRRIKSGVLAPRVLIYSAYASPLLALPALVAGADGLVDKGLEARALFEAIRLVHRGERLIEPPSQYLLREALERLEERDRAIVGMLLDDAATPEIGRALGLEPREAEQAVRRILSQLRVEVPAASG